MYVYETFCTNQKNSFTGGVTELQKQLNTSVFRHEEAEDSTSVVSNAWGASRRLSLFVLDHVSICDALDSPDKSEERKRYFSTQSKMHMSQFMGLGHYT